MPTRRIDPPRAVDPETEDGDLYRYRLYLEYGTEAGEARYAAMIKPSRTIWLNASEKARVLDVVAVEEDGSPCVGFLKVEAV